MSRIAQRAIVWTPRVLCIAFAVLISVFALDVFGEHLPFWKTLLALAMHLVPTAVLVLATLLAWRSPAVGGVVFISLGFLYLWMVNMRWLGIAVIAFAIGLLFLASWVWRAELKPAT